MTHNQTQKHLTEIERLVKAYSETSSRMALTQLRTKVTKLLNSNPLLKVRVMGIFETNHLSITTL